LEYGFAEITSKQGAISTWESVVLLKTIISKKEESSWQNKYNVSYEKNVPFAEKYKFCTQKDIIHS